MQTQIKSNLINLLMTKKGERLFNPAFGCDIHSMVFDSMTETLKSDMESAVLEAIATWLPQISVTNFDTVYDEDSNRVAIKLQYRLVNNSTITDSISIII